MAQEYSDIRKISNIDVQTVVEVLKARSTSNFSERGFVSSRRDGDLYLVSTPDQQSNRHRSARDLPTKDTPCDL
jgi:hypothetical protein